ncbi:hypothetical protein ACH47Z_35840 [Streptomyces sp. NPDC020192]|uniref:hypothetical protein n=1 Tax=Streptomyces sp. NPDC020192 TaxID=3365066 RepID=UPI00379D53E5
MAQQGPSDSWCHADGDRGFLNRILGQQSRQGYSQHCGDTVQHVNEVRVIAVATGRSDEAALRDAGAEVVLPDLRDAELLVKLVRSGG